MAAKLRLHPTDYKALGVLKRLGPMSAGELGRHTGLAAASVTNLIDRLASKGLLRREPDPVDRRRVLLHAELADLTENEFVASWQRSSSHVWQRYTDTDLAVILDFLTDTAARLRNRTETIAGSRVGVSTRQERRHHVAPRVQ